MIKQQSLKKEVSFSGVGVHSGIVSHLTIRPAFANEGIVIQKANCSDQKIRIGSAVPEFVQYATVLSSGAWKVSTIEHVMAALAILGIDNAVIELEGDEFPILDGSSLPFVEKMVQAGIVELGERRLFLTPKEPLSFKDEKEGRELYMAPAAHLDGQGKIDTTLYVEYEANFDHPALKDSKVVSCFLLGDRNQEALDHIVPARTFGFLEQLPFLKKMGLAQGASLDNTVVLDKDGYVNQRRFDDECIRHKLLDLIGDLALLGHFLAGHVRACRTGHSFNRRVIEHYIKNPDQWALV